MSNVYYIENEEKYISNIPNKEFTEYTTIVKACSITINNLV